MNFCKFSTEVISSKHTVIDNLFITDYLPLAPDLAVKVYLFGLQKCTSPNSQDNDLNCFSDTFGISKEDILSLYLYWQDQGLVQVLSTEPFEIRYLPVKRNANIKKWNDTKFSSFNSQIQEILCGRMITPNEYNEYYTVIDTFKIEPDALVAIAKYCTEIKGETVGHAYINTVARIWAAEGIKTKEAVKEKLESCALVSIDTSLVLKELGLKRKASIEEQNLFTKWTNVLGFDKGTISLVAKMLKKQKKNTFEKLDNALVNYYEAKMLSFFEIEEFENNKENLFNTAKNINKALGVWYESLDAEVSEFISKWVGLGFCEDTLTSVASHCFKKNVRTLQGMNEVITKFHKLGIISSEALKQYIEDLASMDKTIKNLLEIMGVCREVNQWDRTLYKCWSQDWKFPEDIIEYAVSLSTGKSLPMQYANKILSSWLEKKIKTLEEAKKLSETVTSVNKVNPTKVVAREYTSAELSALFDNLEEIEI